MPVPVLYHEGVFPPTELNWESLIPLVGSANAAVARYDGLLSAVPNAAVLLSPSDYSGGSPFISYRGHPGNHGRGAGV